MENKQPDEMDAAIEHLADEFEKFAEDVKQSKSPLRKLERNDAKPKKPKTRAQKQKVKQHRKRSKAARKVNR